MGIKKEFTAYNGLRCDYHAIVDIEFDLKSGTCDAIVGAHQTADEAKQRRNTIDRVRIQCNGVTPGEDILAQLYPIVAADPRYAGGEEF